MSDRKLAFLISLTLHLILLFLSYFLIVKGTDQENFKEIKLIEFQSGSFVQEKIETKKSQKEKYSPEKINLPKSFSNLDDENLFEDDIEVENETQNIKTEKIENSLEVSENAEIEDFYEDLEENRISEGVLDSVYLNSLAKNLEEKIEKNRAYLLEGEVKDRKIIQKEIPLYPKDLSLNGEVKIKFSVKPSGEVKNIVILKKSYHKFEINSIKSLKKWKFNEISSKQDQTGIITFYYELK